MQSTAEILVQSRRLRAELLFYRTLESCDGGPFQFTRFTKLCHEVCTELTREVTTRFGGSSGKIEIEFLAIEWLDEQIDDGEPVITSPFCVITSSSPETLQQIWEQRSMLEDRWIVKRRAIKGSWMRKVEIVTGIKDWRVLRGAEPIDKVTWAKTGWIFFYEVKEHEDQHPPRPTDEEDLGFMQETWAGAEATLKARWYRRDAITVAAARYSREELEAMNQQIDPRSEISLTQPLRQALGKFKFKPNLKPKPKPKKPCPETSSGVKEAYVETASSKPSGVKKAKAYPETAFSEPRQRQRTDDSVVMERSAKKRHGSDGSDTKCTVGGKAIIGSASTSTKVDSGDHAGKGDLEKEGHEKSNDEPAVETAAESDAVEGEPVKGEVAGEAVKVGPVEGEPVEVAAVEGDAVEGEAVVKGPAVVGKDTVVKGEPMVGGKADIIEQEPVVEPAEAAEPDAVTVCPLSPQRPIQP